MSTPHPYRKQRIPGACKQATTQTMVGVWANPPTYGRHIAFKTGTHPS